MPGRLFKIAVKIKKGGGGGGGRGWRKERKGGERCYFEWGEGDACSTIIMAKVGAYSCEGAY